MFNKKRGFLILLLMIVGICAMSSVSATDDVTEALMLDDASDTIIAEEASDAVASDVSNADDVVVSVDEDLEKMGESYNGDTQLSKNQDDGVLSSSDYRLYSVNLNEEYQISSYSKGTIKGTVSPPSSYMPGYKFKLNIYDVNLNFIRTIKEPSGYSTSFSATIPAKTLVPGVYILAAENDYEGHIMDTAVLKVSGNVVITATDNYNSKYMSGATINGQITDSSSGKPCGSMNIGVTFTNGKTTVTKYYKVNSNGQFSFEPPVGVGTWTVTISSGLNYVSGSVVKKSTITKSGVSIKASKIVEYKGFKTKLKATVKVGNKKVNEGKVAFKINGKTYKVNVKNGVATKKINLKKIKTYKYTAKYLGTANLKASKNVKAKATLKKRQNVKIKFKRPVVYMGQTKKVVVKITSKGKKVKSGLLYIRHKNGVDKVKVTKGRVVLYAVGLVSDHYKGTNGITTYYKKTVTKKFWMKYVPTEHKYKGVKVNYKATSKYKCPTCGKKGSHNHYSYGWFVRYTYHIKVS